MKRFTIRAATASDETAVRALIRQVGINPMGIYWPRFLVALDDAQSLIGCAQVKPHRDGSRELASLAVFPSWRRRGVARALVATLQDQHGAPVWLTCIDHLVPFYEQFGFEHIQTTAEMPPYFRRASRFFNLYLALTRYEGRLAVMVWQG